MSTPRPLKFWKIAKNKLGNMDQTEWALLFLYSLQTFDYWCKKAITPSKQSTLFWLRNNYDSIKSSIIFHLESEGSLFISAAVKQK